MSRQVKRVNISGKEDKSNKVTSLSDNSTNKIKRKLRRIKC